MRSALVVIGSPNPNSFAHAMAARATAALQQRGVTCDVHDLYLEESWLEAVERAIADR